ncbi:olfactory receptor 51G2-like [Pelodiscus sinensis]|uniref:olfactory receptor 51G2-like n=1 Tax=Pelodiscus sinensis TaxID=13735 RepID=UPI003F6C838A
MSAVNDTTFTHAAFLLTGIPGQEDYHVWISIAFCLLYAISIVGNSVILFIVIKDPSLHEPMYIFLSMLALTDLGLSITTMPTILGIYLFNSKVITLDACLTQLFFIHTLQCIESSILLLMAFDRFIAICIPLRYTSLLTLPRTLLMGLVCVLRGVASMFPLPLLLKRYRYCRANILSHSYCLHQAVMKMACSDIQVNNIYGLFITLLTMGLDSLLILLSYVMILKTALSVVSLGKCLKPLNTCLPHICAVLLFYTAELSLAVIYRYVKGSSHLLAVLVGYVSLLVPPVMNPIIYSIKSKQLRARITRVFVK